MKNLLAVAVGVAATANVLSDAEQFALALRRWERQRTPLSLLHLATSGFFLVRDVAALG